MQLRFIAIFLALTLLATTNAFKFNTEESEKELGTESPILLKNPFAAAAKVTSTEDPNLQEINTTTNEDADDDGDTVIFGDEDPLPVETKSAQGKIANLKKALVVQDAFLSVRCGIIISITPQ